jgi:predicted MFS family arabinose efflux permease
MIVMFAGSALILSSLPRDKAEPVPDSRNFTQDLNDGLRYVWSNKVLKTLVGTFAVAGLAVGLMQPLMLFVVIENLGRDKQFLQWLLMAYGAAMLAGGGLIMGLSKKLKPQTLLAVGLLASTLGTLGLGWSESVLLTLLFQMLNGLFYPCIHIGINTIILKNTEGAFIGRVGGVLTPMFMGMMVIGMSVAGTMKDGLSLFIVFAVSAVLFLLGALLLVPILGDRTGNKGNRGRSANM